MCGSDPFRIAYVGGGSRFVVTLLHGLAARAEELRSLNRPVELALMDPDARRAGPMAKYAEITARQTHLPITATVTDDLAEAVRAADWVIFSAGMHGRERAVRERFGQDIPASVHEESGARLAMTAAATWPVVREIVENMRQSAPGGVFSTLVNPTGVTAGAVERAFGVPSIGICVEVGGLIGFLSYYLGEPAASIRLEHVGVNHVGWVGRWTVGGRDGDRIFRDRMPARLWQPDWYPGSQLVVELHEALGCLRSSAYHNWPYRSAWGPRHDAQARTWLKTCLPRWDSKQAFRQAKLTKALAAGRMIDEPDSLTVHPEATPYSYPDTRHVLGALAVGLAGGSAGPVALQVRNGDSNPALPAEAWVEVPTRVEAGRCVPQTVPLPPPALVAQLRLIAEQRRLLADWLVAADRSALAEALLAFPDIPSAEMLIELSRSLEL